MVNKLLLLAVLLLPSFATAQWTDGGLDQTGNVSGNGPMISVGNTLIFANGERGIVRSTDNGATWHDANENATSGYISKFAASNGKIWAARSYGTGTGELYVSTDDGLNWQLDTVGSQRHALGWAGYAVISDMYAWAGHLFIKWDAPDAYDIRLPNGTYTRPTYWKDNDPHSVVAKGNTLYSISNGLSYTTDFGVTWTKAENNGFRAGTMLTVDGERLYMVASEGFNQPNHLFYSDDNGDNWTKIDASAVSGRTGLGGLFTSITAYYVKGENIYLGAQPTQMYGSKPNVFRSTNTGLTWFADTNGLGTPYYSSVLGFNYHTDGKIWVIPGLDNIYWQQLDDGGPADPVLPGSARLLSPQSGSVLQDENVMFVWSSITGAQRYQLQISTKADYSDLIVNDSSVTDTTKLVKLTAGATYYWRVRGVAPDKIKQKGGGRVQKLSGWTMGYFSISVGGAGWELVQSKGLLDMEIFNDAIYVATAEGVKKSTDEGASWITLPAPVQTGTVDVLMPAGDRLYLRAFDPKSSDGFFGYTTNDGATWTWDTLGIGENAFYMYGLTYWDGNIILGAAGTGSHYLRRSGETAFQLLEIPNVYGFTALGDTVFTYIGNKYQLSTDGGLNWTEFAGPKNCGMVDCIRMMRGLEGKLYVLAQKDQYGDTLTLFVSADRGTTWSEISLGEYGTRNLTGGPTGIGSMVVMGDTLYLGMNYDDEFDYVIRSFDNGATWTADTAGAWEQFVGAGFKDMYLYRGSIWARSEGSLQSTGSLYRKRIAPQDVAPELTAPTLISPANDSQLPNAQFAYSWSSVTGASSYQLQVSYQSDLSDLVQHDSLISTTTRQNTVSGTAPFFYWRVRALNGDRVGPWSTVGHFTVELQSVLTDNDAVARISVYPNPAIDQVMLQSADGIRGLTIVDATGKAIETLRLTGVHEHTLELGTLPAGSYSIIVETAKGEHFVKRLVVH